MQYSVRDKTENIRARIVFPMIVAGFLLIFLSLMGGYWLQKNAIEESVD